MTEDVHPWAQELAEMFADEHDVAVPTNDQGNIVAHPGAVAVPRGWYRIQQHIAEALIENFETQLFNIELSDRVPNPSVSDDPPAYARAIRDSQGNLVIDKSGPPPLTG